MNLKLWRALFCYLQIFTAVTLLGAGLLQVTSDLSQVLYLRLQSLNLRESRRYHSGPLIIFCRTLNLLHFCGVGCELGFLERHPKLFKTSVTAVSLFHSNLLF